MAPRLCSNQGCPQWVEGGTHCDQHRKEKQNLNRSNYERVRYGSNWAKTRTRHLSLYPSCQCDDPKCKCKGGCDEQATEVDHIVNLKWFAERYTRAEAWRIAHHEANLKALCKPCHSSKTMRFDVNR